MHFWSPRGNCSLIYGSTLTWGSSVLRNETVTLRSFLPALGVVPFIVTGVQRDINYPIVVSCSSMLLTWITSCWDGVHRILGTDRLMWKSGKGFVPCIPCQSA